jgi:hypothetical protein
MSAPAGTGRDPQDIATDPRPAPRDASDTALRSPTGVSTRRLQGWRTGVVAVVCFSALVATLWVPTRMATPALIEEPGLYLVADQGIPLVPAGSFNEAHRLRPFDGVAFALGHWLSADSFRGLSVLLIAVFVAKGLVAFALFRKLLPGHAGSSLLAAGLVVVYPADSGLMLLRFTHVHLALTCGLLAVLLLLLLAERWRSWLIPLIWLAVVFSVGTYEAAGPLLVAAPALLLLRGRPDAASLSRLCAVWYAPIAAFAAWAFVTHLSMKSDETQQDLLLRSLSWSDAVHHGVPALLRAYRWHFWDAWSNVVTSVYEHPSALLGGVLVGAVFLLAASWLDDGGEPKAPRRDLAIAAIIGLVALGLGYVAYAMLPSHRDLTDRLQTAAPGAALAVSALVVLLVARRAMALTLLACLLAVAAAGALQQNRSWVDVKTTQDRLISELVQTAPAFEQPDTTVVVVDDTGALSTDYSFQYPEVLANRVRQLYGAPGLEVTLCYPRHTFPWGCTLGAKGADITYAGERLGPTISYGRAVFLEYDLDGRLRLLDDLSELTSDRLQPPDYHPRDLIALRADPPKRAATEISPWPPTRDVPPTLRPRDHVDFEFGSGIAGPGWGGGASDARGRSFQWSVDNIASLTTSLSAGRDFRMELVVLQTFVPDLARALELAVNHVLLRHRTTKEPDGTYCVLATIPREVLARTRLYDRIDVIVPRLAGPGETDAALGVAADELEVSAIDPRSQGSGSEPSLGCHR